MISPIHTPLVHPKDLFGAKGVGLMDMARLNLPVPPGFVLSTTVCNQKDLSGFKDSLRQSMAELEATTGQWFGGNSTEHPSMAFSARLPLLVSVRSGASVSMPGMMDTLLNVGINQEVFRHLSWKDAPLAESIATHFLRTYSKLVFAKPLPNDCKGFEACKKSIHALTGKPFCEDVYQQLEDAIHAVWASFQSPRAIAYRNQQGISHKGSTAVIVQAMVFGNFKKDSGTGVLFTRNPSTGQKECFGEYLPSAQGEDLVSGNSTPKPLSSLSTELPEHYESLVRMAQQLEAFYGDMQDIEFTIEQGKVWLLQTRSGKRTAEASFKIASDMVKEGLISVPQALINLDPACCAHYLHPKLTHQEGLTFLGKGLQASPGACTGIVTLDPLSTKSHHILLREETTSEDIQAMMTAKGVVTLRGGVTSHAAVVMRGLGKPCIVAMENATWRSRSASPGEITCEATLQHAADESVVINGVTLRAGDYITLDAHAGHLFLGEGMISDAPSKAEEMLEVMGWADDQRQLQVLANADTPLDILTALDLGAEGVGLTRSEHMILEPTRLHLMQEFILADSVALKQKALDALLPLHQQDIYALFEALEGRVLTFRLLDPPLHEFLPSKAALRDLVQSLDQPLELAQRLEQRLDRLHEINPMLGHRGCRLGISFPEIYAMQIQALFSAAKSYLQRGGSVNLNILIPFIMDPEEFIHLKNMIQAQNLQIPHQIPYQLGAMIEVPRAALLVQALAPHADFLSFGTNDLTQMTWGLSRDDCAGFFKAYETLGLQDPFQHFDEVGVGGLMAWACLQARKSNPSIKLSVCGEHAGTPKAISFFQSLSMDSISCSPWKIPIARIAAARAALHTAST